MYLHEDRELFQEDEVFAPIIPHWYSWFEIHWVQTTKVRKH